MDNDYGSKGLVILGFPSNSMNQEKGTPEEINEYARTKHGAKFWISEKIAVNGKDTHPVYAYLRENSSLKDAEDKVGEIPWNYAKFLVDSNGKVIKFALPAVAPLDLLPDIKKYIDA